MTIIRFSNPVQEWLRIIFADKLCKFQWSKFNISRGEYAGDFIR